MVWLQRQGRGLVLGKGRVRGRGKQTTVKRPCPIARKCLSLTLMENTVFRKNYSDLIEVFTRAEIIAAISQDK